MRRFISCISASRTIDAREERAQTLVEYALIIAVVSLGALGALGFLSGKIQTLFSNAGSSLAAVPSTTGTTTVPLAGAPLDDQGVQNGSVQVVGGGTAVVTLVGGFGGVWNTAAATGYLGSSTVTGGGLFRLVGGSNPSAGSACGFTLDNGYQFVGKTWHFGLWDDPADPDVLSTYQWACY